MERIMNLNNKSTSKLRNIMSKKPTYRDEANALIHQCLRVGFIEDLHAGKESKILDNEGYSRITNKEMKKLMIETSAKLADFLEQKEKNPDKYNQIINSITLMYTHDWETATESYSIKNE